MPIAGWFITAPRGDHSTCTSHLHHVCQLCYLTRITIRSRSIPWARGSPDGLPLFPAPNQASDDAQQRGMLFAYAEVFWLEQADCLWRV
jgi:hypothetical protein